LKWEASTKYQLGNTLAVAIQMTINVASQDISES